jgi:hypothetical protein
MLNSRLGLAINEEGIAGPLPGLLEGLNVRRRAAMP